MKESKDSLVGKTGLTNGEIKERMTRRYQRGLTNGAGKGGFTNGAGKGEQGFTNGMAERGFTNGMAGDGISDKIETPYYRRSKKNKTRKIISFGIILLFIFSAVMLGQESIYENYSEIDGNFDNWQDPINLTFAKMDIIKDESTMTIHLKRDNMFIGDGEKADSYLIFIDDKTRVDGFLLGYESYEYYIEIYGTNNTLEGAKCYQFDESRANYDWNGFNSRYNTVNLRRAFDSNNIEMEIKSVMLGRTNLSDISLLVYHFYPNTNFEYSQVIDVNKDATYGEYHLGTRNEYASNYIQNIEDETLTINTIHSLAYSYIPYKVKVIKEQKPIVSTTNQNTTTTTNNTYIPIKEHNMYTNLTIEYEGKGEDLIRQCGGTVISSTLKNVTISDKGYLINNVNKTVKKCIINGEFGYEEVYKQQTRASLQFNNIPLLNSGEEPRPFQTVGTNTDLEARPTSLYLDGGVTIDGDIGTFLTHTEWYPSEYYFVNVASNDLDVGVMMDREYLYVYLDNYQQTQNNTQDLGEIYFDTWHDENTSPNNASYKKIQLTAGGTLRYAEGSGTGWSAQTIPSGWEAGQSYVGGSTDHQYYEFKVPLDDLSVSGTWDDHLDEIGFGARVKDGQGTDQTTWYPSQYYLGDTPPTQYEDKPDEWGDIIYTNYTVQVNQDDIVTPTIDGELDETEWDTLANNITVDATQDMNIYFMMNETYLYYGCIMLGDTTEDAGDFAQIFFCPEPTGELYPDVDEFGFSLSGDNTTQYYIGTGAGWTGTTTPTGWVAKAGFTNGYRSWEFQIPVFNLTSFDSFNETGEEIIFLVMTTDSGGGFTLQYPDYYGGSHDMRFDPQAWVHMMVIIPEFDSPLIVFCGILFINIFIFTKIRKDKRSGEDEDN